MKRAVSLTKYIRVEYTYITKNLTTFLAFTNIWIGKKNIDFSQVYIKLINFVIFSIKKDDLKEFNNMIH